MLSISLANCQKLLRIDARRLRRVARDILRQSGIHRGALSIAIVDDAAIAELHARYLDDPEPTDVLSFLLESSAELLEGEVIASAETAARVAAAHGWTAADELLLYVIHGTLHLVGYDDRTAAARARMRRQEQCVLEKEGLAPRSKPERHE